MYHATPRLSFIIPVLNDLDALRRQSEWLTPLAKSHQIIIVDGGSRDGSREWLQSTPFYCLQTAAGRARQMNTGAALADGDILVFLHADTQLPDAAPVLIAEALSDAHWGHFDIRLCPGGPPQAIIAWFMNHRSRLTRIATGDQTLFFQRHFFEQTGGFAEIPLMEDVEICGRSRKRARPAIVNQPALTSARRWQEHGVIRTIVLMWELRLRYWLGESPDSLHRRYYPEAR